MIEVFMQNHEPAIRLAAFIGMLAVMACWEGISPRRQRLVSRWTRWPGNLGISALNTLLLRFAVPVTAVGLAVLANGRHWGLFNNIELPRWLKIVLSLLLFDLAIYLQHVMFHAVPVFWRFHRMHHADLDFDFTTGSRFHPVEILLSLTYKCAVITVLGPPVAAVIAFEVILNATSMFNHGNVGLPNRLEKYVRWLLITPDMHRVHHSVVVDEANSNFGFNLSWWDRVLGTYRARPAAEQEFMTVGLDVFRDRQELRLDRMLRQPFVVSTDHYSINARDSEYEF